MNLTAVEVKPFVPASDFGRAKQFYLAYRVQRARGKVVQAPLEVRYLGRSA